MSTLGHTCVCRWNARVFALEHPNVGASASEIAHLHTHTHAYLPVQTRVCTDVTYSCAVSMSKHSLTPQIVMNMPVPRGAVHCRVCQHVQSWLCEKVVFARICTPKVGPSTHKSLCLRRTHMCLPLKHTCVYAWTHMCLPLEPVVSALEQMHVCSHTSSHIYRIYVYICIYTCVYIFSIRHCATVRALV